MAAGCAVDNQPKSRFGPRDSNALGFLLHDEVRQAWCCPYCQAVLLTDAELSVLRTFMEVQVRVGIARANHRCGPKEAPMPDHQSDLAHRIELVLAAAPGSMAKKAEALKVHRSTLHRWASGAVEPTTDQVAAVAGLLGLPPAVVHYGPTPVLRSLLPTRVDRAAARRLAGSAADVAAAVGVHRSTVSRWRKGKQQTGES